MKREDIKKIFPDATEEQLKGLLDINTADIGKAKGELEAVKADLEKANGTLKEYETTIADMKKSAEAARLLIFLFLLIPSMRKMFLQPQRKTRKWKQDTLNLFLWMALAKVSLTKQLLTRNYFSPSGRFLYDSKFSETGLGTLA